MLCPKINKRDVKTFKGIFNWRCLLRYFGFNSIQLESLLLKFLVSLNFVLRQFGDLHKSANFSPFALFC